MTSSSNKRHLGKQIITRDNLQLSVVNMFTAGTDGTTSTLSFGLLLMAKYPEVQGKEQSMRLNY